MHVTNLSSCVTIYPKIFKKSHICEKNIVCIPLCNGVHFQGYVIDVSKKEVIHID